MVRKVYSLWIRLSSEIVQTDMMDGMKINSAKPKRYRPKGMMGGLSEAVTKALAYPVATKIQMAAIAKKMLSKTRNATVIFSSEEIVASFL